MVIRRMRTGRPVDLRSPDHRQIRFTRSRKGGGRRESTVPPTASPVAGPYVAGAYGHGAVQAGADLGLVDPGRLRALAPLRLVRGDTYRAATFGVAQCAQSHSRRAVAHCGRWRLAPEPL